MKMAKAGPISFGRNVNMDDPTGSVNRKMNAGYEIQGGLD